MNEIEINVSRMPWVPDNDTYVKIREAILWKHEHSNKTVLDLISSEKIAETDYLKIGKNILAFSSDIPSALTTDDISSVFSTEITEPINRYLNSKGLKIYHEMYVVSAIEKATHTHDNLDVLNNFSDDNGTLKYNEQTVGGFSIKTKFLNAGVDCDIYDGYGSDLIGVMYPTENGKYPLGENSVIIDVGIVLSDGTEIRSSQFPQIKNFDSDAIYNIFATPQYEEEYGTYVFFRLFKENINGLTLYQTIADLNYLGVNVYYLGGN